jgi:nitrate reductase delta subunit
MSLWADAIDPRAAFAPVRTGLAHLRAVERVKEWTYGRFSLAPGETIIVSEGASALPGYPPLQTAVAFWTEDGLRHHFTVFKPVEDVAEDDIPPSWMKAALAMSDGVSCDCC